MNDRTTNILLCGVGGQGILLASEIISSVLMKNRYDVKQSEVHGMAQRGGSVVSHIRYGKKVYSPLIEPGCADFVVSFELLEALRYLPYYSKESKLIINTQRILPAPVTAGTESYPDNIFDQLAVRGLAVFPVDAFEAASSVGEGRAVNMVLVGALSTFLHVEEKLFFEVIDGKVREKMRKVNREAFAIGRKSVGVRH